MTSPRFTTAELQEHRESISKGGCGTPKKRSNLKKLKMGTHRTIARKKKKVTKPFDPLWRDVGKSSRAARVAAAAARGAGKGMTSAERSAAAKKGWETRRRKGYKPKSKVGTRQLHGRPVTDKSVVRTSGRKPGGVTQEKAVKQLGPKNGSTAIRRAAVKRAVDAGKGRADTRSERAKALQTAASRDGRVTAARHGNQRRKKWADQDAKTAAERALLHANGRAGVAIGDLRYQIRSIEDAKKQMKAERRDARGSSDYADMPAQRRYDERLKNLRAALKILRIQHQSVKPPKR